jgi:hypothetical protein
VAALRRELTIANRGVHGVVANQLFSPRSRYVSLVDANARRPKRDHFKKLDSTLKKNTAFIKKVKLVGPESIESVLIEMSKVSAKHTSIDRLHILIIVLFYSSIVRDI